MRLPSLPMPKAGSAPRRAPTSMTAKYVSRRDVVRRKELPSGGLLFCAENIASAVVLNFVYTKPPLKKAIGLCL